MHTRTGGKRSHAWVPVVGLTAVFVYAALTVAAVGLYPGSTSPVDTFLSDLGSADFSPTWWPIYDLAMILGGLLSLPFFVGLSRSYSGRGRRGLLLTGLVAGIVNGVSVVMAGAITEHIHMGVHIGWSMLIFVSFLPLLVVYGLIFWRAGGFSRAIAVYGFLVCLADLGLIAALASTGPTAGPGSLMEWVAVFTYLLWVALVSVDLLTRLRAQNFVRSG